MEKKVSKTLSNWLESLGPAYSELAKGGIVHSEDVENADKPIYTFGLEGDPGYYTVTSNNTVYTDGEKLKTMAIDTISAKELFNKYVDVWSEGLVGKVEPIGPEETVTYKDVLSRRKKSNGVTDDIPVDQALLVAGDEALDVEAFTLYTKCKHAVSESYKAPTAKLVYLATNNGVVSSGSCKNCKGG